MRITERRLRRVISSVIKEFIDNDENSNIKSQGQRFNVGDVVLVRHTDGWSDGSSSGVELSRSQGEHAMDWAGCAGVIKSCNPDGTCDINDPEKELDDLTNLPMREKYIELIGNSVSDNSGLFE